MPRDTDASSGQVAELRRLLDQALADKEQLERTNQVGCHWTNMRNMPVCCLLTRSKDSLSELYRGMVTSQARLEDLRRRSYQAVNQKRVEMSKWPS